jgi:hypothetical protein
MSEGWNEHELELICSEITKAEARLVIQQAVLPSLVMKGFKQAAVFTQCSIAITKQSLGYLRFHLALIEGHRGHLVAQEPRCASTSPESNETRLGS